MKELKLLTAEQLIERTQIGKITLHRLTKRGVIPHYRIGNSLRYDLKEVLEATKVKN